MPDDKMEIIRGCMISYDCGDRVTKCETCGWNVREAERRKERLRHGGLVTDEKRGVRRLIVKK